jgi:DNA repair protein RadC
MAPARPFVEYGADDAEFTLPATRSARRSDMRRARYDERPRERLLAHGAASLTDAELVALLLRTGSRGRTAVELAHDLLDAAGGVGALIAPQSLRAIVPGVGVAKAAGLAAVGELARRALVRVAAAQDALASPQAVRDYLRLTLDGREHEVFVGLYLDSQNRLIGAEELFRGTLAQTSVYPREIVKAALSRNAAAMIFAHNHPSGVAEPSRADELLTQALKQALTLIDVKVLDHFIVGGTHTMSFAERGLL